jgi:hypothetical protein
MHGHGEIDFRKEKKRTKNKLVSTKSIFFRIFSNSSVIVLQKPHKRSLLLDPKLQLMLHKTEHVSFSRSEKLYNQPKERGLLHKHTHTHTHTHTQRSSSTTTTTTGPWQHHHHPSLKQDRGKKKTEKTHSIQNLWSQKKALCTQPTLQPVVVLLCGVGEASFTCKKWDANGVAAKWVFKKKKEKKMAKELGLSIIII